MYRQILVLLSLVTIALCYPDGAPKEACRNLDPTSHGRSTAKGPPPYRLIIGAKNYTPKQKIKITLAGIGSAMYKGFLLQARTTQNDSTDPQGFFSHYNSSTSKTVCEKESGNGVTQRNSHVKSSQNFVWQAPGSNVGDIIFHYTVVRGGAPDTNSHKSDYFKDIKSPALPPAQTQDKPFIKINIV